jgi:hypothetical protein
VTSRHVFLCAVVGLTLVAVGCENDDLFTVTPPPYAGSVMFARYVSMGNSITAGFQSGGINDSTQQQSYAKLLAAAMGSPFNYPSLAKPGCPPPFTNIFTQARVGTGSTGTTCLLRSPNIPPPYLSNVAVPGAEVLDLFTSGPTPNSNVLTLLMLGGRSQTQAMMEGRPTFVSVWAGNNDLLGAAEAGDTTLATDTATFRARYAQVLDSIDATGAKALLIAVGLGHLINNVVIPFFSRGSTWFGVAASGAFAPAPFTVASNCASPRGDTVLVSFAYGFGLLATAQGGTATTLDCTAPPVVEPAETRFFVALQVRYNAIIQAEATARGWAFTDSVNTMMDSLAAVLPAGSQFAPFPNIGSPSNPNPCSTSPFGLAFSCDGLHPSAATHHLIARKLGRAINAYYNSAIPAVP